MEENYNIIRGNKVSSLRIAACLSVYKTNHSYKSHHNWIVKYDMFRFTVAMVDGGRPQQDEDASRGATPRRASPGVYSIHSRGLRDRCLSLANVAGEQFTTTTLVQEPCRTHPLSTSVSVPQLSGAGRSAAGAEYGDAVPYEVELLIGGSPIGSPTSNVDPDILDYESDPEIAATQAAIGSAVQASGSSTSPLAMDTEALPAAVPHAPAMDPVHITSVEPHAPLITGTCLLVLATMIPLANEFCHMLQHMAL
jgi:hypothetical protein